MGKTKHGFGQLEVKIYSQFHTYFDGGAESLSAINKTGAFDILPGHANFFTILTSGIITIMSQGEKFEYKVNRGVAQVSDNSVKVFIDI